MEQLESAIIRKIDSFREHETEDPVLPSQMQFHRAQHIIPGSY